MIAFPSSSKAPESGPIAYQDSSDAHGLDRTLRVDIAERAELLGELFAENDVFAVRW